MGMLFFVVERVMMAYLVLVFIHEGAGLLERIQSVWTNCFLFLYLGRNRCD